MGAASGYIMVVTGPLAAKIAAFFAGMALVCPATAALAAPRRVAVINAATDQEAGAEAAARVRASLVAEAALAPLPAGSLARALEGPLPQETALDRALAAAQQNMARAQTLTETFAFNDALSELLHAETVLAPHAPEGAARVLLAEVNVRRGVVLMAKPDRVLATEAFRLAHRLNPGRQSLDPATYDPEVVKTFAAAAAAPAAEAFLEVAAAYDGARLYVNGNPVSGPRIAVEAGIHVVTATFPEHRPSGTTVRLTAGQTRAVKLELWPQSSDERAVALRRQLRGDNQRKRVRAAAQAAAALTGADAVVVLRGGGPGAIEAAVYDTRDGQEQAWMPVDGTDPKVLFEPLLPAVTITSVPDPFKVRNPPPPPPEVPWYKERRWQAVIGGGAVATVLGIVALSVTLGSDTHTVNGNTFGGFSQP